MKTRICTLILFLALLINIIPAGARRMYAPDGRSAEIAKSETDAYRRVGWYDVPVKYMYTPDGKREVIAVDEAKDYRRVGWYDEAVKYMYAPDGRREVIAIDEAKDYRRVGWYDEAVKYMYAPDGRREVVAVDEAKDYRCVGWYDEPVTVMYSPDGRQTIAYISDIPSYESCGWHKEPVALMTKNGVYEYVLISLMDKYREEGWDVSRYYSSLYGLGTQIEQYIGRKSGRYGIYIKNLSTGDSLIINDGQFSSASIIKLFVMAGTYNEISRGNIEYNSDIKSYLTAMITQSDNYSSNRLVKAIGGGNYLQGFNRENEFSHLTECINTQHKSLFAGCGEYVSYGNNRVSPYDCGILLEKIYNGTLISEQYSKEMLNLLKNQQRRNKIPQPLPAGTVCANKTGENKSVQSDVGIVYSPNCDYIICVITNNAQAGILDIREISKMTYDYFN